MNNKAFASKKSKVQQNLSEKIYDKVFKVRLKGTPQEFPLTPEFLKSLEQEYAIKYLESLKIEPTKTNIAMVLRNNPLSSCKFAAGWNSSGLIADSLTVVARQKPKITGEKIHNYTYDDLKKPRNIIEKAPETETKFKKDEKLKEPMKGSVKSSMKDIRSKMGDDEKKEEEEVKYRFQIDYTLESIKKRYLYPFNETKLKKHYQNLIDDDKVTYLPKNEGPENEVFTSKKYFFPFSQVKVTTNVLKDLQVPLKVSTPDIAKQIAKFLEHFPFYQIPHSRSDDDANLGGSFDKRKLPDLRKAFLKDKDLEATKNIIKTEEVNRVIGIFLHLCYWQVFGHVNPVQPDIMTKKQMIIACMEQMNKLRKLVKNGKIWNLFVMPMIILIIRMMVEFFLRNSYHTLFETDTAGDVAIEKVNLLISNMLDQNNFFSRMTFFESEVEAINKKFNEHLHEGNLRNKRIYGTSPYLDLLFPNPQSDFVRTMLHKKNINKEIEKISTNTMIPEIKDEEGDESGNPQQSRRYLEQSYQVKMFQLLLDKVDDDLPYQFKRKNPPLNFSKENV